MKLKTKILFYLMLMLVVSCDEKRVFDEYKSVGSSWKKNDIVSFDIPKLESTKHYNLFLNIRNNNDYPFNNLFLKVSLENPDGLVKVDTLEYQMANPDGSLLGEGFSDIKESKLFFKEKIKFEKKGNYKIKIQQAVRQSGKVSGEKELKGITEVGFRIESSN
jgi:gliding motility-associated lipoprotein GldH